MEIRVLKRVEAEYNVKNLSATNSNHVFFQKSSIQQKNIGIFAHFTIFNVLN